MSSVSLRTKIYLGFAVLVGLLVLNGLVSYFGLVQLRDTSVRKQRINDVNATVLAFDRDVQELRLRVDRYVASGNESLREEVGTLQERLRNIVRVVESEPLDAEVEYLFKAIGNHIEAYEGHFAQVVKERRVREDLVQFQLPSLAASVRSELSRLNSVDAEGAAPTRSGLALSQCRAHFTEAERSFLRYFATPGTEEVNSAADSLSAARESLREVEQVDEARRLIREYERIGLRAVQATRGYLFFRNVVMAGEASEVAYYAEALRKLATKKNAAIDAEVAETRDRVNRAAIASVAAAAALAAIIALRLTYLIVPPILALTRAFNRLSGGETLEEIPGVERRDEIGEMAQAARVFSDRNQQTRELLERSEKLSDNLQKQTVELAETNRELDNFAYVASHDLKSPLRGIRQLATWIEEDAAEILPEGSKKHLKQMRSRVEKMERLLEDLLDYSRIGREKPQSETLDLSEMISSLVELTDNPKQVAVTYPTERPPVKTFRVPLEQVLRNLIGNAIKYNHHESGGQVTIDWNLERDFCNIVVSDNGPGIAPKDQERAFQMYQRVGDTKTDGTGMGLALVKKQIESMDCSVELKSSLGDGASFEFSWPVLPD